MGTKHTSVTRTCTQATKQEVFGRLYDWFFSRLAFKSHTLDFDSTVMVREGVGRKIRGRARRAGAKKKEPHAWGSL